MLSKGCNFFCAVSLGPLDDMRCLYVCKFIADKNKVKYSPQKSEHKNGVLGLRPKTAIGGVGVGGFGV